ncbi:MAG: hypothetical protein CMJ78_21350 [Planctomycetaceae bacterium]|nr:hypothetical protein [Planctomycetaceae bacterium]
MLRKLWNDELGVVLTAEFILIMTIMVIATVVGISEVAVATSNELNNVSNAIGASNRSYGYTGFSTLTPSGDRQNFSSGATWIDDVDNCGTNHTCDLVRGADSSSTEEQP